MEYISKTMEFNCKEPAVITFGKFDGLHCGHKLLLKEIMKIKEKEGCKTIFFTFDVPPRSRVISREAAVLTTNEEKRYIFEKSGIDMLVVCPFTPEVMSMEPEAFIRWIVASLNIRYIVVGTDFCFGHKRSGNYETLLNCEEKYGYKTIVMEKMQEDGRDISSTFVREEIRAGHIEKANHLLGYEFFVRGQVVHGNQIGRTMGIPTINMRLPAEKLLPPFGVYVTRVQIGDKSFRGISNIGIKPTIAGEHPVGLETFILDFDADVYDEMMTVSFLTFVRPEKRFANLEELQRQIEADTSYAREYYGNVTEVC